LFILLYSQSGSFGVVFKAQFFGKRRSEEPLQIAVKQLIVAEGDLEAAATVISDFKSEVSVMARLQVYT